VLSHTKTLHTVITHSSDILSSITFFASFSVFYEVYSKSMFMRIEACISVAYSYSAGIGAVSIATGYGLGNRRVGV
jgi:hypothetical protein